MSDSVQVIIPPLTAEERADYERNNLIISEKLHAFVDVGNALADNNRRRLYRDDYANFEDYCFGEWGFKKSQGYRLIDAAEVVGALSALYPNGDTGVEAHYLLPTHEAQVRPLATDDFTPEQKRIIWEIAQKTAPGKAVTFAHVSALVEVGRTVLETQAIDGGDGEDIPIERAQLGHFKDAVLEEAKERMAQNGQRITDHLKQELVGRFDAQLVEFGGGEVTFHLAGGKLPDIHSGVKYRILIYQDRQSYGE